MESVAPPEERPLRRALRLRHLIMLSVGGTIASGFLLASGGAIALAGPGVFITYIVAGLVSIGVMACLSELSVRGYTASGFAKFAEETMGPLMGFLTGWNYWLAWVAGPAAEAVAVGTFATFLPPFHGVPIWVIAFVVITVDLAINFVGVLTMGNYEMVLSIIKIVGLIIFTLVCFAAVLGIGQPAIGTNVLTGHGGLIPLGAAGLFTSFVLVFYAYTGIELVSVGAEESVHPERDVPRALMGTAALVTVIFVIASIAMVSVVSWQTLGTSSSPLVGALTTIHQPIFANILTIAIIVASISGIDAGIYTGSRMLFSLARDSFFPAWFARTNSKSQVPTTALLVTGLCMYVGVVADLLSPTLAYIFLGSLSTLGFLWAWLMIPIMQMLYRRRMTPEELRDLKWKLPFGPVIPVACILLIGVAVIAPIFQNTPGIGPISAGALPVVGGVLWMGIWTIYYLVYGRRLRAAGAAAALAESGRS
jgi:L-asparagine transporter-like permease